MYTLIILIVGSISLKWLLMWDKSIKNKNDILEYLPKNEKLLRIFLGLTLFSLIIVLLLITIYLP